MRAASTCLQPDVLSRTRVHSGVLLDDFSSTNNPLSGWAASGSDGAGVGGQSTGGIAVGTSASANWAVYKSSGTYGPNIDVMGTPVTVDASNGGHAWFDLLLKDVGNPATVDSYGVELHRGNTPDTIIIWKTTNGTSVQKGTVNFQWVDGYRLRAVVTVSGGNTTIDVYVDNGTGWALVLTYTDSTSPFQAAGPIGIGGRADAAFTSGGWSDIYSTGLVTSNQKIVMVI